MSARVVSLGEKDLAAYADAINGLAQGRSNAVGTFTIAASAATTVVSSKTCGADSLILLMPKTANAAAALATTYITAIGPGTFTVNHANNAQTDRHFSYVAVG